MLPLGATSRDRFSVLCLHLDALTGLWVTCGVLTRTLWQPVSSCCRTAPTSTRQTATGEARCTTPPSWVTLGTIQRHTANMHITSKPTFQSKSSQPVFSVLNYDNRIKFISEPVRAASSQTEVCWQTTDSFTHQEKINISFRHGAQNH